MISFFLLSRFVHLSISLPISKRFEPIKPICSRSGVPYILSHTLYRTRSGRWRKRNDFGRVYYIHKRYDNNNKRNIIEFYCTNSNNRRVTFLRNGVLIYYYYCNCVRTRIFRVTRDVIGLVLLTRDVLIETCMNNTKIQNVSAVQCY